MMFPAIPEPRRAKPHLMRKGMVLGGRQEQSCFLNQLPTKRETCHRKGGRASCFWDRPGTQQTLRNVCEIEWNKLENAGYLFLWFQRSSPLGALCRQIISGQDTACFL